jgi:hypothetical protein
VYLFPESRGKIVRFAPEFELARAREIVQGFEIDPFLEIVLDRGIDIAGNNQS